MTKKKVLGRFFGCRFLGCRFFGDGFFGYRWFFRSRCFYFSFFRRSSFLGGWGELDASLLGCFGEASFATGSSAFADEIFLDGSIDFTVCCTESSGAWLGVERLGCGLDIAFDTDIALAALGGLLHAFDG